MYDEIDIRLHLCRRRNNYDCTLNIMQQSVTISRPNTDNGDVEKIIIGDFRQITRTNSKTSTVASGLRVSANRLIGRCIINPHPNCALTLYVISWLCQNLSSLALNILVVLDTTQLGKLFHVFTTLLEKLHSSTCFYCVIRLRGVYI